MTDPISPAAVARADERRRLHAAGIQDESLIDHIIDTLTADRDLHYEPLSGQSWTPDAHTLISRVIDLTIERAAQHIISRGFQADRRRDVRVGMYEAAQIIKEMR